MFAKCALTAREFVRWKLRLDRIFELLAAEKPGIGNVVDLGCGYGMLLDLRLSGIMAGAWLVATWMRAASPSLVRHLAP